MGIAIVFPDFDRIMAFLGSAMCIVICVILPICYYFEILGHEILWGERVLCWFLLVVAVVCATVGTIWTYIPPPPLFRGWSLIVASCRRGFWSRDGVWSSGRFDSIYISDRKSG